MTDQVSRLSPDIEHLHGPEEIPYGEDELVVVCLVRNGQPYIRSFIDHYLSLGVKHIVFLDNDSNDDTVAFARDHERVTILRTELPYKKYKYAMKQYLIHRFGKGRWSLCVDIDELFDYPYSDAIGLNSLLGYLNSKSYTAVTAQMLDMFPEDPLSGRMGEPDERSLKELHRFYDISRIKSKPAKRSAHLYNNTFGSDEIELFRGGIRDTLFEVVPLLTKFPLVFVDGRVKPLADSSHEIENARIADFSCVLFHYKFLEYFHEQAVRAVQEENYADNSAEYKKYLEVLQRNSTLKVKQQTSKEITGVNDLLEDQFLVVSNDYVSWVNAQEKKDALQALQREPRELAEALLESRRQERAKILRIQRLEQQLRDRDRTSRQDQQRLRQRVRKHKQRLETKALRIQRLEQQLRDRDRTSRQDQQRLRQQVRKYEQELESMRASRAWRLAEVLHRIKVRVLSFGRSSP